MPNTEALDSQARIEAIKLWQKCNPPEAHPPKSLQELTQEPKNPQKPPRFIVVGNLDYPGSGFIDFLDIIAKNWASQQALTSPFSLDEDSLGTKLLPVHVYPHRKFKPDPMIRERMKTLGVDMRIHQRSRSSLKRVARHSSDQVIVYVETRSHHEYSAISAHHESLLRQFSNSVIAPLAGRPNITIINSLKLT